MTLSEELKKKILTLSERAWESRIRWPDVERWLENFQGRVTTVEAEHLHALFLLSNFMFFGSGQIRQLLKSAYRDLFRYPLLQEIRKKRSDTLDGSVIESQFLDELDRTRFIGMGNPSESGVHLLYFFRQENALSKDMFMESHRLVKRDRTNGKTIATLREPLVRRYVFIDDFCGSGQQAAEYSTDILEEVRQLDTDISFHYLVLFGTTDGLNRVASSTLFDKNVSCVYELDSSFKCFSRESRVFVAKPKDIDRDVAHRLATEYGSQLWVQHPLGYRDGQLLIGFHHNIPDNTLPIVWFEGAAHAWTPIFRRYPKEVE